MGEKMSLEQVKAEMWEHMGHGFPRAEDDDMQRWIDAIDAHPTQPAQSVDVAKVREVIESHINEAKKLRHDPESQDYLYEQADKLEAALQEKSP